MTTSADYLEFIRNGHKIPGTAVRWTDIFDGRPLPPTWDHIYGLIPPRVVVDETVIDCSSQVKCAARDRCTPTLRKECQSNGECCWVNRLRVVARTIPPLDHH